METICILYSTASVNMTYMYIWQRVLGLNMESCEFDKNLSEEQKPFSNRWNSCCIVVVLIMSNDSHIWLGQIQWMFQYFLANFKAFLTYCWFQFITTSNIDLRLRSTDFVKIFCTVRLKPSEDFIAQVCSINTKTSSRFSSFWPSWIISSWSKQW